MTLPALTEQTSTAYWAFDEPRYLGHRVFSELAGRADVISFREGHARSAGVPGSVRPHLSIEVRDREALKSEPTSEPNPMAELMSP